MEDEIDSKFICSICCEVLKAPVITPCCHKFCKDCLSECYRRSKLCPVCRNDIDIKSCINDTLLNNEISSTTVICIPCGQKLSLLHFNVHVVTCSKRKVPHPQSKPIQPTKQQPRPDVPNRSTFSCPLCDASNLDCTGLVEHCNTVHRNSKHVQVVCPICASMPWGNRDQVSSDFLRHLNIRHNFEYDTFVDYEQDDEEALRAAIEASLVEK